MKNPEVFYGKEVIVSGEVEQVMNQRAISIGGDEYLGGRLLIVSNEPLPTVVNRPQYPNIRKGDIIQLHGVLKNLPIIEVERDFGFDLEREYEVELENRPILVAGKTVVTGRIT